VGLGGPDVGRRSRVLWLCGGERVDEDEFTRTVVPGMRARRAGAHRQHLLARRPGRLRRHRLLPRHHIRRGRHLSNPSSPRSPPWASRSPSSNPPPSAPTGPAPPCGSPRSASTTTPQPSAHGRGLELDERAVNSRPSWTRPQLSHLRSPQTHAFTHASMRSSQPRRDSGSGGQSAPSHLCRRRRADLVQDPRPVAARSARIRVSRFGGGRRSERRCSAGCSVRRRVR
jgi:hypothetical protein